jgi:hypothetical protein
LDKDRSGSISHEEFVEQLHRLRNGEQNTMLMLIKHDVMMVSDRTDALKSSLEGLQASCDQTQSILEQMLDNSICSTSAVAPASAATSTTPAILEKLLVEPQATADLEKTMAFRAEAIADSPALITTLESEIRGLLGQAQKQIAGEFAQALARIGNPGSQPPRVHASWEIGADGDAVLQRTGDERTLPQRKNQAEPALDSVEKESPGMLACCAGPKRSVGTGACRIPTN